MMEILVFSDSHGKWARMNTVYDRQTVRPAAVFFLGDGLRDVERADFGDVDVFSVCGNCDSYGFFPAVSGAAPIERMVEMGGFRFLLMHGHTHGVKSGFESAAAYAAQRGADALLFGHTHTPLSLTLSAGETVGRVVLEKPLCVFNPGSLWEGSFGHITVQNGCILASHGSL